MTNPKVDSFFETATQWPAELQRLRSILQDTPLTEEFKWRGPCYTFDGGNVLILGEFKDGCRVTFFKGALLEDPDGLLGEIGDNSHAGRLLRFTDVDEIDRAEPALRDFVQQGIAAEEAGLKVEEPERGEARAPRRAGRGVRRGGRPTGRLGGSDAGAAAGLRPPLRRRQEVGDPNRADREAHPEDLRGQGDARPLGRWAPRRQSDQLCR